MIGLRRGLICLLQFGILCGPLSLSRTAYSEENREESEEKSLLIKSAYFAGHVLPVIPLMRSLKDKNKRFYMLVETPVMGLVNDPAGALLARTLMGKEFLTSDTLVAMAQSYISYQLSQIVRNGVTLEENISPRMKVLMNWWISTLVYGLVTGVPALSKAHASGDPHANIYAYSTVAFAAIWPIITQNLQTRLIIPFFFSSYPNKTLLDKIADERFSRSELVDEKINEILSIRQSAAGSELTKAEKAKIKALEKQVYWINWFRKDNYLNDKSELLRKKRAYWLRKTGTVFVVASMMISSYHMTRWNLVGSRSQPEEWGPLTKIVQVVADYVRPEGQKKLSDAEVNDLTKTVVYQVEQSGLTPAQSPKEVAIPEKASSGAAPSANCRSLLMRLKR
ncbi:MAG: hypothetical protein WCK43_06575 [bacterium]